MTLHAGGKTYTMMGEKSNGVPGLVDLCVDQLFSSIDAQSEKDYMVRVSYDQKPYRRHVMESFGATVYPSPSMNTAAGQSLLEANPDHPGSLGAAISEGIEAAVTSGGEIARAGPGGWVRQAGGKPGRRSPGSPAQTGDGSAGYW